MNYLIVTVYTALAVCLPSMCFTQTWIARYDGPGNGYDAATAIAVDDASNVYVTGYSVSSGINFDYATIKYAPTGVQEDSGSKIHDVRYSLMISPNPFHDRTDIR